MKAILLSLFAVGLFAGCATQHPQQQATMMEGHGKRVIYAASFDQVWHATVHTAGHNGLRFTEKDRKSGYIAGNLTVQPNMSTQSAGIWVRPISPTQTSVEVLRQSGGAPVSNWEDNLLSGIQGNLAQQARVSQPGETVVEPAGAPRPAPRIVPEQGFPPFSPPAY